MRSHEIELLGYDLSKKSKYIDLKSNSKYVKVLQAVKSEEDTLDEDFAALMMKRWHSYLRGFNTCTRRRKGFLGEAVVSEDPASKRRKVVVWYFITKK